jgi:hypothetical protein
VRDFGDVGAATSGFPLMAYSVMKELEGGKEEGQLDLAKLLAYAPSTAYRFMSKIEPRAPSDDVEAAEYAVKHLRWQLVEGDDPVWRKMFEKLGVERPEDIEAEGNKVILQTAKGEIVLYVKYREAEKRAEITIEKGSPLDVALEQAVRELIGEVKPATGKWRFLGWFASDLHYSEKDNVFELGTTQLDQLQAVSRIFGKQANDLYFGIYIGKGISLKYIARWYVNRLEGEAAQYLEWYEEARLRAAQRLKEITKEEVKEALREALNTEAKERTVAKLVEDLKESLRERLERMFRGCSGKDCIAEKIEKVKKSLKIECSNEDECIKRALATLDCSGEDCLDKAAERILGDLNELVVAYSAVTGERVEELEVDPKTGRVVATVLDAMNDKRRTSTSSYYTPWQAMGQ